MEHRLGPSHAHVVGMVLPRSVEVAGTYGGGATWRAFKGVLPGGVRGFVAHVSVPAPHGRPATDEWSVVRARVVGPTLVPELDVHVGRTEPLASPFTDGHPRRVPVGRGARLRVSGDVTADAAAAAGVAVERWLAATDRRWNAELTEGWLTVFTVGPVAVDAPHAELCRAAASLQALLTSAAAG